MLIIEGVGDLCPFTTIGTIAGGRRVDTSNHCQARRWLTMSGSDS
jgi:hypothetical protein